MFSQKRLDIISAFVCICIGMAFIIGSFHYGNLQDIPNPGLFPFLGGSFIVIFSLILLITALLNKESGKEKPFFPEKWSAKNVLWVVSSLVAYVLFIEYLGYPLIIFLFMIFSLRFLMRKKWRITLIFSFFAMLFSYILFVLLLEVQLPRGLIYKIF